MAPKKAPKKAPAHHDLHKAGKDARRTYEHLGRVQALAPLATAEQDSIGILVSAADEAFRSDHFKSSADLLRAAEHLCFAALVQTGSFRISPDMIASVEEELEHLRQRAADHAADEDLPPALHKISTRMWKEMEIALRQASYGRALELARGAEALAHVRHAGPKKLDTDERPKRLRGDR